MKRRHVFVQFAPIAVQPLPSLGHCRIEVTMTADLIDSTLDDPQLGIQHCIVSPHSPPRRATMERLDETFRALDGKLRKQPFGPQMVTPAHGPFITKGRIANP